MYLTSSSRPSSRYLCFSLQRNQPLILCSLNKPTTPLETSVDALLKSAKLREEDLPHTESAMLATQRVSVEEVAERRAELRTMRELMFRAEIKARRVAKIKSKVYRKMKRREREKLGGGDADAGEGGELDEEERRRRDVERARERATLRHKNTGKWAREMKGREGHGEEGGRREIEEMLERGEKLRRRIKGVESEGESEDDDEGESESEDGVERIKRDAFEELKRTGVDDGLEDKKGKSIFDMKFMKNAMARQQHAADRMVDDFIKEMGRGEVTGYEEEEGGDATSTQEVDPESGVVMQRTGGRVTYHPGAVSILIPLFFFFFFFLLQNLNLVFSFRQLNGNPKNHAVSAH